jgi:hypothetical protein
MLTFSVKRTSSTRPLVDSVIFFSRQGAYTTTVLLPTGRLTLPDHGAASRAPYMIEGETRYGAPVVDGDVSMAGGDMNGPPGYSTKDASQFLYW